VPAEDSMPNPSFCQNGAPTRLTSVTDRQKKGVSLEESGEFIPECRKSTLSNALSTSFWVYVIKLTLITKCLELQTRRLNLNLPTGTLSKYQ